MESGKIKEEKIEQRRAGEKNVEGGETWKGRKKREQSRREDR